MRVPWTARRSNQLILKEISPEYSLEGMMLKLKLQYFGHLMQRTDLLEKTLMLGNIEGGRKRGQQRMSWLDGITDLMDMSLSKLWVIQFLHTYVALEQLRGDTPRPRLGVAPMRKNPKSKVRSSGYALLEQL